MEKDDMRPAAEGNEKYKEKSTERVATKVKLMHTMKLDRDLNLR